MRDPSGDHTGEPSPAPDMDVSARASLSSPPCTQMRRAQPKAIVRWPRRSGFCEGFAGSSSPRRRSAAPTAQATITATPARTLRTPRIVPERLRGRPSCCAHADEHDERDLAGAEVVARRLRAVPCRVVG